MQPAYPQKNSCANGQSMNHRFVMPQKYYILSALELLITEGHDRARCKKSTSITGDSPPFNYSKQVTLFMSVWSSRREQPSRANWSFEMGWVHREFILWKPPGRLKLGNLGIRQDQVFTSSGWWLSHPLKNMSSSAGVNIPNWMEKWNSCSKPPNQPSKHHTWLCLKIGHTHTLPSWQGTSNIPME